MKLKTAKILNNSLLIGTCVCLLLIFPLIAVTGNLEEEGQEQVFELNSAFLLGKGQHDLVIDIALGVSGNVYLMGITFSADFPTTPGVYDETHNGGYDVFIQKRSPDGATVLWSTFFGGSVDDGTFDFYTFGKIVLDKNENIIITGHTESSDFPIKGENNFTHNGGFDGFVSKLSSDGTTLLWSTLLGGNNDDIIKSVTTDLLDDVYVFGATNSSNFPIKNGFEENFGGNSDTFIAKVSGEDSELLWTSFLGGTQEDHAYDIEVDKFNSLYLVGATNSIDFPLKSAFDDSLEGGLDVFITKVASDGSEIDFSTFLGGQGEDEGQALVVDSWRNIYVTGITNSEDFPTSVNAFQSSHTGIGDSFITKLAANGTSLEWSTYLGGSAEDISWDIALDNETNVYTVGRTFSDDFPLQDHLYNYTPPNVNSFISSLSKDGDSLLWSTYIGGRGWDDVLSLVVDSQSTLVYFCGATSSSDFPKANDYNKGGADGFVAVLKYPPLTSYTTTGSVSSFETITVLFAFSALVVAVVVVLRKRRK
ncbi:MAG: SBBP repeat-containing protein [Candidatus Hodarchaeales archaeon]|jgi:hypothetical protein